MRLNRPVAAHDPFTLLERMLRDADHAFGARRAPRRAAPRTHRAPLTVEETETAYVIRAPLPGVDAEAFTISVDGARLTISGQRAAETPPSDSDATEAPASRHLVAERWSGAFSREIELPQAVEADAADASFEHGVLTVTLPKTAAVQARRIPVNQN